jgi:multicomponent Na+:H+ antiporter subunit B
MTMPGEKSRPSIIVRATSRMVARLIQIFALYVILHGHYSPGGGFQGGALLAAAAILLRLGEGLHHSHREFAPELALPLGALGALIYMGVGLLSLGNGNYLQFDALPVTGFSPPLLHNWSILVIEMAIGLAVMSVLICIFDRMITGGEHD